MEFIDLAAQQKYIRKQIDENIKAVLDHGKYILGPEVEEIEDMLSDYVGVKHAISCASGTDALLLALMAYKVKPSEYIITTPFTFIATAEVISLLGAIPIFVDIDPVTFNIDPVKIEAIVKNVKVRGIIAVNLFGLPADYEIINLIAKKYDLFVIEDAAQSFGATYQGSKSCSLGDISCTSFFPAKPLGCYGDGGMCFTDDDGMAEVLRLLRTHGESLKYHHTMIGLCSRLDTIQAAVLKAKFEIFPQEIMLRNVVASRYNNLLTDSVLVSPYYVPNGSRSAWAQYSILALSPEHRSSILKALSENNIPSAIYYPVPLHLQKAFEGVHFKEYDLSVSENFSSRVFSIPMHPYLTEEEQEKIVSIIRHKE